MGIPTAVTYQSEQTVALAPKEVDVHVQHKTVHVPIEKRVHYGVKNVVTGSTTQVHKPTLNVPQIKAPEVFVAKTKHAAPEVTVTHSEVQVENKSPNYVNAPFDAGVVVQKAAPKYEETHVPTPVEVAKPYAVPKPYNVPVPHTVKVKSAVKPVHHIDVHSVKTENVVTPIEYAAHHKVISQPTVAVQPTAQLAVHEVKAVKPVQYGTVSATHGAVVAPAVAHGVVSGAVGTVGAVGAVGAVGPAAVGVAYGAAPAVGVVHGAAPAVGVVHGAAQTVGSMGVAPAAVQTYGAVGASPAVVTGSVQGVNTHLVGATGAHLTGAHVTGAHYTGAHVSHHVSGQESNVIQPSHGITHNIVPAVAPKAVISNA